MHFDRIQWAVQTVAEETLYLESRHLPSNQCFAEVLHSQKSQPPQVARIVLGILAVGSSVVVEQWW